MKIDNDLRQAIKAAHKRQLPLSSSQKQAIEHKAIQKFLDDHPILKREVTILLKRKAKLVAELNPLRDKIDKWLHAHGLDDDYEGTRIFLNRHRCQVFTDAGGDLSAIDHNKWEVDEVIAELAAADPKDQAKILRKYGIRWE